jgi:hypothetical protein
MPAKNQKSVLSQLQTVGEDALGKVTQNPAARTALKGAMNLKDRGNQWVTSLLDIDKRLKAVEKRLSALEHQGGTRSTTARKTTSRKPASKPRSSTAKSSSTKSTSSGSGGSSNGQSS